jgi:hypothetical protein
MSVIEILHVCERLLDLGKSKEIPGKMLMENGILSYGAFLSYGSDSRRES